MVNKAHSAGLEKRKTPCISLDGASLGGGSFLHWLVCHEETSDLQLCSVQCLGQNPILCWIAATRFADGGDRHTCIVSMALLAKTDPAPGDRWSWQMTAPAVRISVWLHALKTVCGFKALGRNRWIPMVSALVVQISVGRSCHQVCLAWLSLRSGRSRPVVGPALVSPCLLVSVADEPSTPVMFRCFAALGIIGSLAVP